MPDPTCSNNVCRAMTPYGTDFALSNANHDPACLCVGRQLTPQTLESQPHEHLWLSYLVVEFLRRFCRYCLIGAFALADQLLETCIDRLVHFILSLKVCSGHDWALCGNDAGFCIANFLKSIKAVHKSADPASLSTSRSAAIRFWK